MTFVNDRGGQFTVLRTYYVPRRATRSGEVQMQLVTHDGPLPLDTLEVAVAERFHANTLKKLFPGVRVHRTYAEFAAVLHARLGIGANGDGAKALRLLARIQSGNQVRSVDELYKEMVLERPATYAAADRAIEHFDDLDAAHTAMRTEQHKLELLEPITGIHERKVGAARRLAELDSFGVTGSGDTPLRTWLLQEHLRLIGQAVTTNRADRAATSDALAATTAAERALVADAEAAQEAHRAAGGSTLQSLAMSVEQEKVVRDDRASRRTVLSDRLLPLIDVADASAPDIDSALMSAEAFAVLQLHARQWLAGWEREQERLKRERDGARDRRYPLSHRQAELRRERESLESQKGRVGSRMHELRAEVARASGLSEDELPYVAELLDLAPEEARWRTAVETVLGASARTLLVPLDRLSHFSRAIDGLHLRGRLVFEGVALDLPDLGPADPERIDGKLLFKDSPFSGWVQAHVAEPARNALCVEDASDLDGGGFRVTLAGQTRSGRRGTHGRTEGRSIIGFSNGDAIEELDAELASIGADLDAIDAEVAELDRRAAVLEHQRSAYDAVAVARFDDLDVEASERRLADLESRRTEILGADDELLVLEQQIERLAEQLESTRRVRFGLEERQRELNEQHGRLVDDEDLVNDRLETAAPLALDEEQRDALAADFRAAAAPGDPDDLDRFAETSQRLAERLREAVGDAEAELRRADDELAAIFRAYKLQWESPNLGATAESYGDYARILEEIRGTGLAGRRSEWRRRLTEWSGQDLRAPAGRDGRVGRGHRGPARAHQRDPAPPGVRGRRGPAPDPAATPHPGPRAGLPARPARAHRAACARHRRGRPRAALRRAQPLHGAAAPSGPGRGRHRERARPPPRRTPPRGGQRRALRLADRRAARDLPHPGGEERRREPGAGGLHRRVGAALPPRRRDALAPALRARLPRRGLREGRLRVRRPCRACLEGAGLPAGDRRAARQGHRPRAAHGRAARDHQEQHHAPVVDHLDHRRPERLGADPAHSKSRSSASTEVTSILRASTFSGDSPSRARITCTCGSTQG